MPVPLLLALAVPLTAAAPAAGRAQVQTPAAVARLPACAADQLSLAFDGEGGAFNGMSHGGALMVVRNVGPAACRLGALPVVAYLDAGGAALDVARRSSPFLHPGPVVLPVGLAPGAEASAPLRWIAGDVWGGGPCRAVRAARIAVGGGAVTAALSATICSPAATAASVDQPLLAVDPVL